MKKYFLFVILIILFSCTKDDPDPCEGITCLNGGHCANGQCVCTQGYTGADCSVQVTPTKITITKIQVTKFPATDSNGAGWDLTSGADIRPKLSKGTTLIWNSSTYYENANPTTTYDFTPSPSIEITTPNDQYTIELFDYDTADSDDWMGGFNFYIYSNTNKFPSTLIVETTGSSLSFKLFLTYSW